MTNILIGVVLFFTGSFIGSVVTMFGVVSALANVNAKYKEETGEDFFAFVSEKADEKRIKRNED